MANKDKKFELDGLEYGREEAERMREDLIILRDSALKQNNFNWSVRLSHAIAVWSFMSDEIWGPKE